MEIDDRVLRSAPKWWRSYYEWCYRGKLTYYGNGWNKLTSVSWSFAKIDMRKFRGVIGEDFDLIKLTEDARRISDLVIKDFAMGYYLEVVNKPRVGKSTGVLYGLLRLLLEDERFAGLGNYVIFVVTPNKQLAKNHYRYLVGLWNSAARNLVEGGKHVEIGEADRKGRRLDVIYHLTTRGDLARRVRVRLYLGGADSCLLNKEEHYVDRDCVNCRYFNPGKVPYHLPLLDPWMLKLSGYCPFAVSRGKGFIYNSIIITTLHSFTSYFSHLVVRHGINKVILVLDEVMELYEKSRAVIREIKVEKWMDENVKRHVDEWNRLVGLLRSRLKEFHLERVRHSAGRLRQAVSPGFISALYLGILDSLDTSSGVKELRGSMEKIVEELENIVKNVDSRMMRVRLRRLIRKMREMLSWSFFILTQNNNIKERLVLRFRNPRRYINPKRFPPHVLKRVEEENRRRKPSLIVAGPGSLLTGILRTWREHGISFGVIGTSVIPSISHGVEFVGGGWKAILPLDGLAFSRSEINPVRRIVAFDLVGSADIRYVFSSALTLVGHDVVVASKEEVLMLLKKYGGCVERVEGDRRRGVIDYVVFRKPEGKGYVYLMYPHGRAAMGVDPPIDTVDRVWILGGVRRPPPWLIPIGLRDFVPELLNNGYDSEGLRELLKYGRNGLRYGGVEGLTSSGYVIMYNDKMEVYDNWDFMYDAHVLRQVVGRWFVLNVRKVIYAIKYGLYMSYSGYWDYRRYDRRKIPFFNPKGTNDIEEIDRYLRDLARKYRFGIVSSNGNWEPTEYQFCFTCVVFDTDKIIKNILRRGRTIYESLRLIRRSNGNIRDIGWVRRKILEALLFIVYSDNPHRLKWLKRVYEEKGLYVAFKELLKYLKLEKYESILKIPTRCVKTFSV